MNIQFICVDFQKDFSDPRGKWFNKGSSVNFIKEELIPYLKEKEIIDHRDQVKEGLDVFLEH